MIIDTKTIIFTLILVGVAAYAGLQFIRSFALSIAQENHDANLAMDMTEEARRTKRERDADAAATAAFAKVEPLLPSSVVTKGLSAPQPAKAPVATAAPSRKPLPPSAEANQISMNISPPPSGKVQLNTTVSMAKTKDSIHLEIEEGPVGETPHATEQDDELEAEEGRMEEISPV